MLFLIVFAMGVFVPARSARADMWGASMLAALELNLLNKLDRYIEGVLLAQMKSLAIRTLNKQVDKMFGGGAGSEPLFVTDFREYIGGVSRGYANDVVNDFFTTSLRGKFSVSNYVEVGGLGGGFHQGLDSQINPSARVERAMRHAVTEPQPRFDFDERSLDPNFRNGLSVRSLNVLVGNPMNNAIGASFEVQRVQLAAFLESASIQTVKAQSSGFIPKEQDGKIIAPSGLLESMVTEVKTMANDAITAASNPEELIGGVINSYANQVVNTVIQTGLGRAQTAIANQFGPVGLQISREVGDDLLRNGPGTQFATEVVQQTNIEVQSMAKSVSSGVTRSTCIFCE